MNNQQNNTDVNQNNTDPTLQTPTKEELDAIEYVVPTSKKKVKHRYKQSEKETLSDETESSVNDFVFAQPHNKKKKRKKKKLKVFGIIMGVIAAILVICVSTLLIFNQVGKTAMHNYEDMVIEPPVEQIDDVSSVEDNGKTIKYKGNTYAFNEKVTTVVLMGIDKKEGQVSSDIIGANGQADAIYIAVLDTNNDKVTILGVSRDTIVDVNVYNKDGGFVNTQPMQICLSYAYGDGDHTSCENTITSLERLFYGMQFDTYFSMDIPAISALTDAVGGVTITSQKEFYSDYYGRTIAKGETVKLYGNDAISYTRSRNINELDSNNDRMTSHKEFMTAFLAQTWDSVKSNPSTVVNLYNTIADNSTTNLNTSKMTYLASTAISSLDSYKEVTFLNVPGTVKKGEYAEFYADENALMQIMLDLFYVQVN